MRVHCTLPHVNRPIDAHPTAWRLKILKTILKTKKSTGAEQWELVKKLKWEAWTELGKEIKPLSNQIILKSRQQSTPAV